MYLRAKLKYASSTPLSGNATAYSVAPLFLKLVVDGTTIYNSRFDNVSLPLAPVTTTNGLIVTVNRDNSNNLEPKIRIQGLQPFESTDVQFVVTGTGLNDLDNTFKIWGYDIGNITEGSGINQEFTLVQAPTTPNLTEAYCAPPILIRQPFTDKVWYYKADSSTDTHTYYDSTPALIGSVQGFVVAEDSITINTKSTIGTDTDTSAGVTILPIKWFPEFNLSVSNDCNCDCDCVNSDTNNIAQIDIGVFDHVRVEDTSKYVFKDLQADFYLYNYAGELVDSYKTGENIDPAITIPPILWDSFKLPDIGDFVVKACISAYGTRTGETVNVDGVTTPTGQDFAGGTWFLLVSQVSDKLDLSPIGDSSNIVGDEFLSIEGTVIPPVSSDLWVLEVLGLIYQCCTSVVIKGCNWGLVKQKECNVYTVYNTTNEAITVQVAEMTDLQVFEDTRDLITIDAFGSKDITLDEDNVYTFTLKKLDDTIIIQVIENFCNLKTCLLDLINDLLCQKKCCGECCDDYCKKYYDFNALIIMSNTYFNMLNLEYGLNYFYTVLDDAKLAELYTAKQFLDKFKEFCRNCKSKKKGCGCK